MFIHIHINYLQCNKIKVVINYRLAVYLVVCKNYLFCKTNRSKPKLI